MSSDIPPSRAGHERHYPARLFCPADPTAVSSGPQYVIISLNGEASRHGLTVAAQSPQ